MQKSKSYKIVKHTTLLLIALPAGRRQLQRRNPLRPVREGVRKEELLNLSKSRWDNIIHYALKFSSAVCQSYDNYISPTLAREIH